MSFGWSAGDIIAGLKVVWDIWQAVSDGHLNANYEASQFFDEFHLIFTRLDEWENRKAACASCAKDARLTQSHQDLRQECTSFIKDNFSLIQQVNPSTKASRINHPTWLQRAQFSQSQIIALYKKVSWPSQRETVTKLRQKLGSFLTLAAVDVALDTNDIVRDIRATNADLIATNYKLVTSHLNLVASVTTNLKRITFPLEPGRQQEGIDYPMLKQFERSLRLPQPIGLSKDAPGQLQLPWQNGQKKKELEYAAVRPPTRHTLESSTSEQEEACGFMSQRLANLSMRRKHVETITESGSQETMRPSIQHLLQLLKNMRNYIGYVVGVLNDESQNEDSLAVVDPCDALKKELEAWDTMKERIDREILHPPPSKVFTRASQTIDGPVQSTASSQPIAMPIRSRRGSANLSPRASYDGWMGSDDSPSPSRSPGSFSSSPNDTRRSSSNSGSNSTASMSRPLSFRSEHEYHVNLCYSNYSNHSIDAVIRSISRNDEGDVQSISSISSDGIRKFRHSVDFDSEDPKIQTSMIPFIDNNHVDGISKFRVQFKGTHHLKISEKDGNNGEVTVAAHHRPPTYEFHNEHDFLEFQQLLLNKNIRHCADVKSIKYLVPKEAICRVGTVRLVFEPISRTKSILYFQHMNLAQDQKPGFVEWPVSTFKDPKEPPKKSKTLTLENHDGKALFSGRGIIRRGTQGSVNTIASTESSAGPAFARIQERSSTSGGKSIKGLVFEFYDHQECRKFWEELRKREP